MNDCASPCHLVNVAVSGKNNRPKDHGLGEINVYFAPKVSVGEEHYFYTFLSLMAEIGGYVGLLLGYSLLHVASLISDYLGKKVEKMESENKG